MGNEIENVVPMPSPSRKKGKGNIQEIKNIYSVRTVKTDLREGWYVFVLQRTGQCVDRVNDEGVLLRGADKCFTFREHINGSLMKVDNPCTDIKSESAATTR